MADRWSTEEIGRRIRAVEAAKTPNFRRLLELAGLKPEQDLRFQDWTGVSFAGQDLRGMDFTGARLVHCDFRGAFIDGARFDQAALDWTDRLHRTDLTKAWNWRKYEARWRPSKRRPSDGHLRPGMVFQDAPMAPKMVVVPAGEIWIREATGVDRAFSIQGGGDLSGKQQMLKYRVPTAIAVSEVAVTDEQFSLFLLSNLIRTLTEFRSPLRAVTRLAKNVTSSDAVSYVQWLRQTTGLEYRLLDRMEWEYCCGPVLGPHRSVGPGNPAVRVRSESLGMISESPIGPDWCTDLSGNPFNSINEYLDGFPVVPCMAIEKPMGTHNLLWRLSHEFAQRGQARFRVARSLIA